MSIGEDFAASLNGTAQPSEVQKARQARVLYLGGLTLAKLEQEEEAERTAGTLSEPTANLFRAIKAEKAAAEVDALKSLGQPEVILTEYVRGLRDGRFTEKFQPVVEQLWTDTYKTLAQRSAMEKGIAAGGALATAAVEAVPMMVRGLVEAGKAVTSLSPEDTARSAAAAELGGAQSMRLLRGIGRIGDEDTTAEGLKKIFERDLKELSDIEGTRRYEGKFLRDMAAKAPGLKAAVEDIKLNLTEEDLKRVDDLSNIFDPTELIPIGFVVGKVGKLFGVAAKTEKGRKVMARTFKTAAEAAEEAEALNGVLNKVRKSVGSAMERQGNRIASTTGGAPVSVFFGGLASGLDAGTSFVAAAVASNIPKPLRQAAGSAVAATGRALAKDLPAPLERARLGFNAAAKELAVGAAEGMAGNAIFALGAETPEQAGGLLGTGAGLGGGIVAAGQAFDKGRGLMNVTENRFSPADRKVESTRQPASSYNEGLDDIHNAAVGKLDNSSANAIEEMRRTIVGPKGRLYVVDTPEQAAKIASFYTGQTVDPKDVAANGFSYQPGQTKQGVGVAVVYSQGEAFGHEPGHLLVESFKASDNPEHVKLISDIYQQARQSLPENSARFRDLQAYYNSLLPAGAKPLDVQGVYDEFVAEHFTTVVGGAPAIKFGGDMPLSKKIYDAALTLGEQVGAYQPGLDLTGRSPVSSETLPFKPSPQLAKLVENMLAARQLELSKAVPSDLAQPPVLEQPAPAAGVQNVEVVTPPAQPPGFKKGDPIGNISDPKGTLVFTGAKVWDDKQGPTVRVEGVDTNGNIVRADVPREWLQSPAATAVPPVDVGATVPVPPGLVGQPATAPVAPAPAAPVSAAKPNVRVTTEQQDNFTAPTPEQVEQNRATLEAAAGKPRAETPFFEANILGAKSDEFAPDATVRREQRRLADALEKNFPDYTNPLRAVFQKIFAPFKYLGGDNPRVFGFSFDKLIQNVDVLAGWQTEHPDVKLPYKPGDAQIRTDLQTYLRNQANGYGGGGERLARPADTREGTVTPENPDYTPVKLPREKVEFLNLLMGFEPPQKTTPAAEYFRRFAEQNGLSTGYSPTGSPDTNALRVSLRKAGFNSRLLNSVVENLPIRRIAGELKPRPDIDLQAGDTGITQAGFMPEKKDTRVVNIGLNVPGGESLTEQAVLDALKAEGLDPVRYEMGQSTTEPTLIAEIPAADNAVITRLSEKLGQDAIAVFNPSDQTGVLLGPRAAAWGKFNKDFFLPLSEEKPTLMPSKKEGSMGKRKLRFLNYSNNPDKKTLDPQFFGKSGVTPTSELSGKPRAYAYLKDSPLGQDKGLIDTRKFVHEGEVDGSKIYDGVADVLDYGLIRNKEQADQMLVNRGFTGIYREGADGRQQLEFFEPVEITKSKENKPLVEDDVAAVDSLPALPLEDVDYQAMDAEFARKQAAGEPLYMPAPPIDSEAFKKWFGDSKVVDWDNQPVVLYHGTTRDFTKFKRAAINPENDFGSGFYFTDTPEDASANYAGEGPDLTARLEQRVEQLKDDDASLSEDEAWSMARREFKQHEGAVMPVFVRMENPFVAGGGHRLPETWLEGAKLQNFIQRLARLGEDSKISNEIAGALNYEPEVAASDLLAAARSSETLGYHESESGALDSSELIRQAIEGAGFDGIVDPTVDAKWGSTSRRAAPMEGMTPDTTHYIAFKPTQIKSAIGNQGTFSPRNPDIRYMPKARGITSQLEATLQAIPEKASRQQIEAALRDGVKQKGQLVERPVKAEEMRDIVDQTGRSFEDFLKENPTASKAELLDFVRQNQIQVTETEADPSKYYRYQEPGGENYREIIYQTPEAAPRFTTKDLTESTIDRDGRSRQLYWFIDGPDNSYQISKKEHPTLEGAKEYVVRTKQPYSKGYVSSHFEGTPNYLAHARVNERVVPFDQSRIDAIGQKLVDGMKVKSADSLGSGAPEVGVTRGLITEAEAIAFSKAKGFRNKFNDSIKPAGETMLFAEELQSDLHQLGRKKGYQGSPAATEGWTAKEGSGDPASGPVWEVRDATGHWIMGVPKENAATPEAAIQRAAVRSDRSVESERAPDAPFKKSWHEFVFKNLLRDAAEQGKDWLGWTTGDQQAERYDLSHQLDTISWIDQGDNSIEILGEKGGKELLDRYVDAADLSDAVGKDLAEKILKERAAGKEEGSFEGVDLKVGGEGMRGFYDEILPRFVDKYLKRYGIKTETVDVSGAPEPGMAKYRDGVIVTTEDAVRVHAVKITPELRRDILERGQPAYMPAAAGFTKRPVSIEEAAKLAEAVEREGQYQEEEFFKKVWPSFLRMTGEQLPASKKGFVKAAEQAVQDVSRFLRENPRFLDYYHKDWQATEARLNARFDMGPEDLKAFQIFAGLTSPSTKLPDNIIDAVNTFSQWKQDGNLDSISLATNPATGNRMMGESPFTFRSTTGATKAFSLKAIDGMFREHGISKTADLLKEGVELKELQEFRKSLGYKSAVSNIGPIRQVVMTATGQDRLIPRAFVFGQKVGAYTLNMLGEDQYTTTDIWESRFIRSYFSGMFKENFGLPVNVDEQKIFQEFSAAFGVAFEKQFGEKLSPSALQAVRWFYILDAARRSGYRNAKTNDSISNYTDRAIRHLDRRNQEAGRLGDEELGGAPLEGADLQDPAAGGE